MAVPQILPLLDGRAGRRRDCRALEFLHYRVLYLGWLDCRQALMLPAEPFRPTRADWLQAGVVALALFALYAWSAPRTVALEDDGLFILSSYFLGIEHPPGYPLFGLSLSNHYPLMLLVAPAFVILLWPLRRELLSRFGVLSWLVILGLAPYAWMVRRSWQALPVSFDGPLETIQEIWFFVSRAGYAGIDHSVSAGWLDRVRFFEFFGGELLRQFALLGTLLAVAGFVVQWRILGPRVAALLTVAFLMPSAGLLLLLGFDYDSFRAHVFH